MRQTPKPLARRRARAMRADPTPAEARLWSALRDRQLADAKFRRQVPLSGYILDFVCFEQKLIIEVDGGQHSECVADIHRDALFQALGFRILRFWNDAVLYDLDAVCRHILSELQNCGE